MKTPMKKLLVAAATMLATPCLLQAGFMPKEMSAESKACAECHKKESAAIFLFSIIVALSQR